MKKLPKDKKSLIILPLSFLQNYSAQLPKKEARQARKWYTVFIPNYKTETTSKKRYFGFKKPLITNSSIPSKRSYKNV